MHARTVPTTIPITPKALGNFLCATSSKNTATGAATAVCFVKIADANIKAAIGQADRKLLNTYNPSRLRNTAQKSTLSSGNQ